MDYVGVEIGSSEDKWRLMRGKLLNVLILQDATLLVLPRSVE